jgi:aminoglycoside phosphotransferase (APT) family kinase protein
MDSPVMGVNVESMTKWMAENLGAAAPLTFELIVSGRSNLTYHVVDAIGREFALRRPPVSHVLPTAHDMVREHRVISALRSQGIPVPKALGLCVDDVVNGCPFYVMEFVDGIILRSQNQAEAAFDVASRTTIGENLAATLASLHDLNVDAAGLGELARHDGYIERQLRRWRGQYEQMRVDGISYDGLIEDIGDQLADCIPEQQRVSIVHGDYRLDNTVLDSRGSVRAVLDWEMCTLGDPMADLGLLLVYWTEPGQTALRPNDASAPTLGEGFYSREQVLTAYGKYSTLDISDIAYYQAFGCWKLACIMQGVYARYCAGAAAGDQGSVQGYPIFVARLAEVAKETLDGQGSVFS